VDRKTAVAARDAAQARTLTSHSEPTFVRESCTVRTMVKKLTRAGNSLALVLDKPLLRQLGIDEQTELEISTDGDVLVITPVRSRAHERKLRKAVYKINERYGGLFKRLSE
jgi:antitoxin MazE